MRLLGVGARAVAVVVVARFVVGVVSAGAATVEGDAPLGLTGRQWLMVAHALSFGVTGIVLVAGGARDRRAQALGIVFLLVGTPFFREVLGPVEALPARLAGAVEALFFTVRVDAFTAAFTWWFARDFPRALDTDPLRRVTRTGLRVSLAAGAALLLGRLAAAASVPGFDAATLDAALWPAQFALGAPAYVAMWRRARRSPVDERRRATLLTAGLVLGMTPASLYILVATLSPAFLEAVPLSTAGWVLYPLFLTTPLTTAYAVLVRRALDVRVALRRAVQYVLARYTAAALLAVPALLLAAAVYRARDRRLTELVTSGWWLALLSTSVAGLTMLVTRRGVLDGIDRLFFREHYDARHILAGLVDRCRATRTRRELADVLRTEIDRALHLYVVDVLFLDATAQALVASETEAPALAVASSLVDALSRRPGGVEVDLGRDAGTRLALSDAERHWLADAGFRLLIPLREAGARVIGCLALGDKRSELAFSREDRALLAAVASAAEMAIAYQSLSAGERAARAAVDPSPATDDATAAECSACGAVQHAARDACEQCGGALVPCALPRTVAGKFGVERRIGSGGMGVVYRAIDLQLGRPVALKTLPHVSPEEAVRLRREARAMALVSHPNLATIYGAETSNGRPTLIFEYLAGGTLRDRLACGPLAVREALDLGVALASVLAVVHDAGILHRDIKPSNIGFTGDGVPKLLDFGLARILDAAAARDGARPSSGPHPFPRPGDSLAGMTSEWAVQGTPSYMSPEALRGRRPDASFDLWALALVLYEAVAGRHPLAGGGIVALAALAAPRVPGGPAAIPDVRAHAPHVPAPVAAFLAAALAVEPDGRPPTARDMATRLRQLRSAGHGARAATPDAVRNAAPGPS